MEHNMNLKGAAALSEGAAKDAQAAKYLREIAESFSEVGRLIYIGQIEDAKELAHRRWAELSNALTR